MLVHGRRCFALALGFAAAATAGCKKDAPPPAQEQASAPAPAEEFSVASVDVGKGIGADKRISSPTTTFKPRDTIYVAVRTEGAAPSKTIAARWTFEDGQVVDEGTETIAPTGPATTEFHIAKPSGWPAGKYKVEISVDGASAGSKDFEVKP